MLLFLGMLEWMLALLLQSCFFARWLISRDTILCADLKDFGEKLFVSITVEHQLGMPGYMRVKSLANKKFHRCIASRVGCGHGVQFGAWHHSENVATRRQCRVAHYKRVMDIRFDCVCDLGFYGGSGKDQKKQATRRQDES